MFTVPGWSLTTPIATQTEKASAKPTPEGKKARKRKQKRDDEQVDAANIGEYWAQVIEGESNPSSGANSQIVKARKEKPQSPSGQVDGAEDGAVKDDAAETKQSKKRKRGKKDKGDKAQNEGFDAGAPKNVAQEDSTGSAGMPIPNIGATETTKATEATEAPSKRDKKKRKKDHKPLDTTTPVMIAPPPIIDISTLLPTPKGLTPLQKSMRAKLTSARFRHLNESLYTKPSTDSLDLFKENPEMFEDYHRGFAQQVEVWPSNPVDIFHDALTTRGKVRVKDPWKDKKRKDKKTGTKAAEAESSVVQTDGVKPLPRNFKGLATIADLGCGTASLAYRLQLHLKPLNMTIHSFDLSKPTGPTAPLVTVADISSLPLPDNSVDVAIFCLALMGTNWLDFIDEAYRILRWRGELWVSEIKSRFGRVTKNKVPINSVGSLKKPDKKEKKKDGAKGGKKGADKPEEEGIQDSDDEAELAQNVDGVESNTSGTDVTTFVNVLRKRGFVLDALPERPNDAVDLSNKMFVKMQFVKGTQPTSGKNVQKEGPEKGGGLRMGLKGRKFTAVAEDEEGDDEVDGKVLKPCVYKIR
jgi:ribosomal RNA-processing protein 8